jgi:hypothetical protein
MVDTATKNTLTKWVLKLDGKVATLERDFALGNIQGLAKQVETYRSEIEQLLDYADQHNIDILEYYDKFSGISYRLITLTGKIEAQRRGARQQDQSLWYTVLSGISAIVWIILTITGNVSLALITEKVQTLLLPGPEKPLIPQFAASLHKQRIKPISSLYMKYSIERCSSELFTYIDELKIKLCARRYLEYIITKYKCKLQALFQRAWDLL